MMLNASGKIAPPPPWITRATSMTATDDVSAATTEPTISDASTIRSTRFLPNMSPSRPSTGVATEALMRYAVSTQATVDWLVLRAFPIAGSAGSTIDCSRMYESAESESTPSVSVGRWRS